MHAFEQRVASAASDLSSLLQIDAETATTLVRAGLTGLEEVLTTTAEELSDGTGFDLAKAKLIHEKARQQHEKNLASI